MPSSDKPTRKLAAIMFTDIVGFTKIMTTSEDTAINILQVQDKIFNPILEKHSGNLLKKMGDGLLIEFSSAVNAVECALKIQSAIKEYNKTDGDDFHIRIGIHLGDVLLLGDDILGDGVNIASRIEPLASPDGICITEAVNQSIKSKLKIDARRISEVDLKHIDDKYTLYKVPNVEPEKLILNDSLDIDNNKHISIKSINDETNNLKEYFKALSYLCFSTFLSLTSILLVIKLFNFSIISRFSALHLSPLIIIILLGAFFQYFKKMKITFEDLRDIPFLLDVIVLDMGYKMVGKKDSTLSYIHYPRKDWMVNRIKKTKLYQRFTMGLNNLNIDFNGNTVLIYGSKVHINRIINKLKERSLMS